MAIANPKAACESLPDSNSHMPDQHTSIQESSSQKEIASAAARPYNNPLASVAVVHPRLCAREFTQVRQRENLLAHVCDEFEVCSVPDDKVWIRADGMRCVAGNNRAFLDEDYRPVARFSEMGTRALSAVKFEGPGYEFLVKLKKGLMNMKVTAIARNQLTGQDIKVGVVAKKELLHVYMEDEVRKINLSLAKVQRRVQMGWSENLNSQHRVHIMTVSPGVDVVFCILLCAAYERLIPPMKTHHRTGSTDDLRKLATPALHSLLGIRCFLVLSGSSNSKHSLERGQLHVWQQQQIYFDLTSCCNRGKG